MLSEIKDVRQIPNEGFRRWFTNFDHDLIIWFENDQIIGFQFCYGKHTTQRAITWFRKGGFLHAKVDTGERIYGGGSRKTPILVADGVFDREAIAERFTEISARVDDNLVSFVHEKLLEYPGK